MIIQFGLSKSVRIWLQGLKVVILFSIMWIKLTCCKLTLNLVLWPMELNTDNNACMLMIFEHNSFVTWFSCVLFSNVNWARGFLIELEVVIYHWLYLQATETICLYSYFWLGLALLFAEMFFIKTFDRYKINSIQLKWPNWNWQFVWQTRTTVK